ncbi:TIGR03885 family FMN-dependent LLM class oxidoreductase [Microbacterium sp. CIAB417]|uniref:TIGR03885 family FMN-dependent LLM class oxidoreductase n=1 Tax=Microbacterium sp. CIAB417 TaxID=2860287 RepID=UPI001FAD4CDF|nr:TIGR03885 family FMN-dependent LLM class oxidoreductase [Microbacterium sp. CIAB417]
MVVIGFHASHEQVAPEALLQAVRDAEAAGFDAAMCSDHLAPWSLAQGESGFAWSWIGAALALTRFPIGLVTAPGQRYHPVITAQAVATLGAMFPGRFWAALGSGEALNEHVTGDAWPDKQHRDRRLRECAEVIRALVAGERVNADGEVRVHEARVWSRPDAPPDLLAAAVSPETAAEVAEWADGLITVGTDPAAAAQTHDAYRAAGGTGPTAVQIHVSLAESDAEALALARDQWAHSTIPPDRMWDLEQPEEFDALADPTEDRLRAGVLVESSAAALAARVAAVAEGFDRIYLHHVGQDQADFLARCERELLPELRRLL